MKQMQKYRLELGMNTLHIPGGLNGAHVAPQPGVQGLCQLWTLASPGEPDEAVSVYVAATGEQIEDQPYIALQHLGTVLLSGGGMVFHALLVKDA